MVNALQKRYSLRPRGQRPAEETQEDPPENEEAVGSEEQAAFKW
jgi:hypothetical protein